MAVPGPITSMASSGTNRLLHETVARAVSEPAEAAALLLGHGLANQPGPMDGLESQVAAGAVAAHVLTGIPPQAQTVLAALPRRGGRPVEVVAREAELDPAHCLAQLGLLEIAGLATRAKAGWRRSG
jgi:DNA processing protein